MNAKKIATPVHHQLLIALAILVAGALACEETSVTAPPLPESTEIPIAITSTPIVGNFSVESSNTIPPEDVRKEIANVIFNAPRCTGDYTSPTIDAADHADWLQPIEIDICEVQPNEEINLTITFPDGSKTDVTVTAYDQASMAQYLYQPSSDQQNGWYTFAFSGPSGQGEHQIQVSTPNEPRIYFVNDLQVYYLYGFTPQERIRFFLYNTPFDLTTGLTAWQAYQADEQGRLLINVNSERGFYTAIGDVSGPARNVEDVSLH